MSFRLTISVITSSTISKQYPPTSTLSKNLKLIHHFPSFIQPLIEDIMNVEGDGNCGFRAVAVALGRDQSEWPPIRNLLKSNMEYNHFFYQKMFKEGYKEILSTIDWFTGECLNNKEKWMVMPEFGAIITNSFNRPVVYLSHAQCLTFLPTINTDNVCKEIIGIGWFSEHFVSIQLTNDCPLPPIAGSWRKWCEGYWDDDL